MSKLRSLWYRGWSKNKAAKIIFLFLLVVAAKGITPSTPTFQRYLCHAWGLTAKNETVSATKFVDVWSQGGVFLKGD